jgi:hypothetical protein
MGIIKSFDIKNLLPFKKRDGMPESGNGQEEKMIGLDPTLSHEEQAYVGHYIGYADLLLGTPEPQIAPIEKRVVEIPAPNKQPDVVTKMEKDEEVA